MANQFKQLNNLNELRLSKLAKLKLIRQEEINNIEVELEKILNNIYNINLKDIKNINEKPLNRLLLEEDLKLFSRFSEQKLFITQEIEYLEDETSKVLLFDNKINKIKKQLKKEKMKKKEKKLYKNLLN
jgi:hypothetical protein